MSTLFCHDITVVSRLTEIEMGSHGWPTVNAHLQARVQDACAQHNAIT